MTTNMGSQLIRETLEHLTDANRQQVIDSTRQQVMEMLKESIRPEFLNRIDEIIMFTPLNRPEIRRIVELQVAGIAKMLAANGVTLDITPAAVDRLAVDGYDPEFGARPVKRTIHRLVLNQLSKDILAQRVNRDRPIVIDVGPTDNLIFRN
jgi:ATP-dependent Clp protease ATP-binding subunit ClpB